MTELPAPGIYSNVSFAAYQKWPAVNQSSLKLLKQTPARARWVMENPSDPSDEVVIGNAAHCLILEPDDFNLRYLKNIEGDGRRTDIKFARAEIRETAEKYGLTVLSHDDFFLVHSWAEAVLKTDKASQLLRESTKELSAIWLDSATKQTCKARLDAWAEQSGVVIDVKTCADASPAAFARSIWNFGYHNQAAFYRTALRALGFSPEHHVFICIEKSAPYCVAVYRLDDAIINAGELENQELLRLWATCARDNNWPGYPDKVVDIAVPGYAIRELEERYGSLT